MTAAGNLTNITEITGGDSPDPNPNNNTANQIAIATPQQANLALTKTANKRRPRRGKKVTFTLLLRNNGPGAATGVQVSDPLPAGLSFVRTASISQGTFNPATGVWTVGSLANGAQATLRIVGRVNGRGTLTNTAQAEAAEADPDLANNLSSIVLAIRGGLASSISKRSFLSSAGGTVPAPA